MPNLECVDCCLFDVAESLSNQIVDLYVERNDTPLELKQAIGQAPKENNGHGIIFEPGHPSGLNDFSTFTTLAQAVNQDRKTTVEVQP